MHPKHQTGVRVIGFRVRTHRGPGGDGKNSFGVTNGINRAKCREFGFWGLVL